MMNGPLGHSQNFNNEKSVRRWTFKLITEERKWTPVDVCGLQWNEMKYYLLEGRWMSGARRYVFYDHVRNYQQQKYFSQQCCYFERSNTHTAHHRAKEPLQQTKAQSAVASAKWHSFKWASKLRVMCLPTWVSSPLNVPLDGWCARVNVRAPKKMQKNKLRTVNYMHKYVQDIVLPRWRALYSLALASEWILRINVSRALLAETKNKTKIKLKRNEEKRWNIKQFCIEYRQ